MFDTYKKRKEPCEYTKEHCTTEANIHSGTRKRMNTESVTYLSAAAICPIHAIACSSIRCSLRCSDRQSFARSCRIDRRVIGSEDAGEADEDGNEEDEEGAEEDVEAVMGMGNGPNSAIRPIAMHAATVRAWSLVGVSHDASVIRAARKAGAGMIPAAEEEDTEAVAADIKEGGDADDADGDKSCSLATCSAMSTPKPRMAPCAFSPSLTEDSRDNRGTNASNNRSTEYIIVHIHTHLNTRLL